MHPHYHISRLARLQEQVLRKQKQDVHIARESGTRVRKDPTGRKELAPQGGLF